MVPNIYRPGWFGENMDAICTCFRIASNLWGWLMWYLKMWNCAESQASNISSNYSSHLIPSSSHCIIRSNGATNLLHKRLFLWQRIYDSNTYIGVYKNHCFKFRELRNMRLLYASVCIAVVIKDIILFKMCQMDKENLNKFMGLCLNGPQYLSVWKFCSRGSLKVVHWIHFQFVFGALFISKRFLEEIR